MFRFAAFFLKEGDGSRMAAANPKMPASSNANDKAIREESGLLDAAEGLSMSKVLKNLDVLASLSFFHLVACPKPP
jgi:hypothetical protein